MERITTEKQTLAFFGALCGAMIAQVPELRMGASFGFWPAFMTLASIVAMVLFTNQIRRGLGKTFTVRTLFAVISVLASIALLMLPEMGAISSANGLSVNPSIPQSLLLKILIISYLIVWSVISYLDSEEPVSW